MNDDAFSGTDAGIETVEADLEGVQGRGLKNLLATAGDDGLSAKVLGAVAADFAFVEA